MKFRVLFKTPDAVEDAIQEQLANDGLYSEESEEAYSAMKSLAGKFTSYGEYVTIEFDTETQTATVVPK